MSSAKTARNVAIPVSIPETASTDPSHPTRQEKQETGSLSMHTLCTTLIEKEFKKKGNLASKAVPAPGNGWVEERKGAATPDPPYFYVSERLGC